MTQVLIIEDDLHICEVIQYYLTKDGRYETTIVHTAEQGISKVESQTFDIIISDIMLPGIDGIDFCKTIRTHIFCPIIFISCLDDDETISKALSIGGDDYLVKPFRGPVLLAHIEANLRRSYQQYTNVQPMTFHALTINKATHLVTRNDEKIDLSPTEYALLCFLASKKGLYVSYEDVFVGVWQKPSIGDYRTLFVHIRNLRKKIEDDPTNPRYIVTKKGGYMFVDE